jgi:hypothetical protein
MLMTHLVGYTLASMVETKGWISAEEAFRCYHECLSILRNAVSLKIQHKDINIEM